MILENFTNKILCGDSFEVLKQIPDKTVDLIFADPPYNLQLKNELYRPNQTKVDGVFDEWDKFENFAEYEHFTQQWLSECKRILKDSGTIWVIGSYHNIFLVGAIIQKLNFWILNDILWIKTNPMPNFKGTRFNNAHETLIWAAKNQHSKYTFHYQSLKIFNDDLQMRSDWYIPICSGNERIKFNGEKAHSTQKPEELLYRIILSTTNIGDLILDPFSGSGTTAAVAKKLRRNFIGIEKNEFYVQISQERIEKIIPFPKEIFEYSIEKPIPKVPFGNLIEKNYISVGEYLFSQDKKHKAQVLTDGSLVWNEIIGSIHKVSATILNKPSNNGWNFWFVERDNDFFVLKNCEKNIEKNFLQNISREQEIIEIFDNLYKKIRDEN